MTLPTQGRAPHEDAGPPVTPFDRLTLTFEAFHQFHRTLWMRFAHTQVGTHKAAEKVVDAACARLQKNWNQALSQESVPRYAWTVLKEEVQNWLDKRGDTPQLVGTAAFRKAVGKLLLHEMRDDFAALSGELGLYAAISRLPERQYDVVVLLFVLGQKEEEVADYLGIEIATVRSHVRHARRSLARELDVRHENEGTGR
ncbi:RNA polymerase sigma factor [Streptomyces sp. NPDC004838]